MARESIRIVASRLLVVEGKEDERFFEAFIDSLGLSDIQVISIGGKTFLRRNLRILAAASGFSEVVSLAVVRDANADPKAAFQSVRDALRNAGLPAPDKPLVFAGDGPCVGVMILPDDETPGILEDVCLGAVSQDSAMVCVEEYFECLKRERVEEPRNVSKAKVEVFLASRPRAGLRLGEAAQAGYWPWGAEAFGGLKDFLRELAEL